MTPQQYIVDSLCMAMENGSDMDIGPMNEAVYAIGVITADILEPAGGECECGYLDSYYDTELGDWAQCPYTRPELRPFLMAALDDFMDSL